MMPKDLRISGETRSIAVRQLRLGTGSGGSPRIGRLIIYGSLTNFVQIPDHVSRRVRNRMMSIDIESESYSVGGRDRVVRRRLPLWEPEPEKNQALMNLY